MNEGKREGLGFGGVQVYGVHPLAAHDFFDHERLETFDNIHRRRPPPLLRLPRKSAPAPPPSLS